MSGLYGNYAFQENRKPPDNKFGTFLCFLAKCYTGSQAYYQFKAQGK